MNKDDATGARKQGVRDHSLFAAAGSLEEFFRNHNEDLGRVADIARKVRKGIQAVDPFVQQHTSVVCAQCLNICCINRHAYYNDDDLIYIHALGLRPHEYEHREDTEPCQFTRGKAAH